MYESLDLFMWSLMKIHCFVWYIILPLFSSHYVSQEITLGKGNRFSIPPIPNPWTKGASAKGAGLFQYKYHTAWPPLPAKFQWMHVSQSNPSERKYLVYYLELCSTKHVTIYIKWKGFFLSVLLSSLQCTHLWIKIKSSQSVGGPLCPMRWPPLPKLLGEGGHFESKSICLIIKIRYPRYIKGTGPG